MPVLNAALAFAITMLILSLVTNVLVETIHRVIRMRQKGLRLMLGHLFDRVIAPLCPGANAEALDKNRSAFLDLMTINRSPTGTALKGEKSVADSDAGFWLWPWDGRRLDNLGLDGFMSRLGGSDFSDDIRMAGAGSQAGLNTVLSDIGQKFQEFGDEASQFFQRRARFLAVVVSMGAAWFLYVHPYEIFATFIDDSAVAQRVIDMQDQTTPDAMAKFAAGTTDNEPAAPVDTATVDGTGQTDPAQMEAAKAEVKVYIDQLTTAGVPIGWTDERLKAAGFAQWEFLNLPYPVLGEKHSLTTIVWLLLGGLLVGLGGPFWYDLVKSLSSIRSLVGLRAAPSDAATNAGGAPGLPQTAIDHFLTSAAGRDAATGAAAAEEEDEPAVG